MVHPLIFTTAIYSVIRRVSVLYRRSGSGAQRDKKQLAKKLINSIQSSSETSGPEQQLTVLITWQNDALHLKCSFASKNWSWPNWMNPACWRILLCNIYNTKRENDQLKSFLQLRETHLYLTVFRTVQCIPDIFLWECFSEPPRWGSGPLQLDGSPAGLGSDAPEGEAPAYTPLLTRPTPPYLREGTTNKEIRGSLYFILILSKQYSNFKQ